MTTTKTKALSDRAFALTHTIRAPAADVFAAYTDAKQLPQWWDPKGGLQVERMDVRVGGGSPVTTTVELAEAAGTTTLTLTTEFPSKEERDAAVQYGALAGAKAALVQLAAFLGGA